MGEFSAEWLLCLTRWLYGGQRIRALIQTRGMAHLLACPQTYSEVFQNPSTLCYSFYIKACVLQGWVTGTAWFLELKADQRQRDNVHLTVSPG